MKDIEQMKQQIEEMPTNQWFEMEDIAGGEHSPELWAYLCCMDDGRHTRQSDGAVFQANEVRLSFVWKRGS